jgi:hypothetical protein
MATRFASAALACAALGAFSLPAVAPTARATGPTRPDVFVLEAGEHDVVDLIDQSALFLGRNYVYAENEVAQAASRKVRLQHRLELDAAGCEEVVSSLAFSVGLAMLPLNPQRGIYEWVLLAGPKRGLVSTAALAMTPQKVQANRNLRIPVTVTYPLQHINAGAATNQLRPFFAAGSVAAITLASAGDSVVIGGFAPEVANAIDLLERIDAAPAEQPAAVPAAWQAQVEQRLRALEKAVEEAKERRTSDDAPPRRASRRAAR